ncbi:hypothetical protein Lesp02_06100 [Lentzea sp. NBRC 105346]|uniref:tetratricopeptide repeat protein n=1 Tax=Lentzea sp. NBRC 105346 TaxID=3032205 RepID=UPI0024A1776F|nr:tetratricopeptide repeat protein [Lentzea sp. NBRC 105346]GLZ28420.1 hypothetical protein Lesp02_06100 [Lentzea sp. NBRC 105346]
MRMLLVVLACLLTVTACAQPEAQPDKRTPLERSVAALQDKARRSPNNAEVLAQLGSAYVELARTKADPGYYDRARKALDESLRITPGNGEAMIGQGALANARHEFAAARDWAVKAQAERPDSAEVQGVLVDALTQLGDDAGASVALQRMLDLRPGVASFTRASYHFELHGRMDEARDALKQALDSASAPEEVAFCELHLGDLAWGAGALDEASEHYERANSLQGKGKVAAARGRTDEAITHYATLVSQVPAPQHLVEYGEVLEKAGRRQEAAEQYDLALKQLRLLGGDDLTAALIAADHGDPAEALRFAEAEWARRQSVFTADAMAWALHVNKRDAEARPFMAKALALGWKDKTVLRHKEVIG